jgi:hypothetical protein
MNFGRYVALALYGALLYAQAKPEPDVLILSDGEKLVGQLKRASGSSVTFKSDIVGEVTVDWSKVQEVHSTRSFAMIPKECEVPAARRYLVDSRR